MRYLSIDPGDKRIGLAVGDDSTKVATPVSVIFATGESERLGAIGQIIKSHEPDALVVGLPLNMDGSEGPAAKKTRCFADRLARRFGLPVHLVDERLSSYDANLKLERTGLTHKGKKRRRDALAAAAILRRFLESV